MPTSSPSFAATIDLTLRPSMRALQWIFVLHVVPVALLPFAMRPGPILAVICGGFARSWLWLRRHPAFGFGKRAIVHVVWGADRKWLLGDAGGRQSAAEPLPP